MYTRIKTPKELEALRHSCKVAAMILDELFKQLEPGISGVDINELAKKEIKKHQVKAAFYGYQGFPGVICVSKNEEVVHGIPNGNAFKSGDIISLDFGVTYKGMISDTARSAIIGEPNAENGKAVKNLLAGTQESLMAGIKVLRDGVTVGDIGAATQEVMERYGLGVVRDLVGHGVGHDLHEDPNIPHHGKKGTGDALQAGMTICIEPMATLGNHQVKVGSDGWTIRTLDRSLSAHYEHTILITKNGSEILTQA